jgi:carboxylesterase
MGRTTSTEELRRQGRVPFSHAGTTGIGALVIHGFTGMPGSVRPLAHRLAEAGHAVECPCLRGHGTRWEDLGGVRMEDWLEDLRASLADLRGRSRIQFVLGLSMGGTLALRLAEEDPSLRGVVAINHALVFRNPLVPVAGLLKGLIRSTPGIASDLMDPDETEPAYDRTPTAGVAQLWRLAKLARRDLPRLKAPLLVFKSRQDHVLPPRNAELTMAEAGSADKQLVWLDRSFHVATLDHDQEAIAEASLAFIRRLSEEP